jgi:hypothetical protein
VIPVPCPHCSARLEFSTESVGKSHPCPWCKQAVEVPLPTEVKYEPPPKKRVPLPPPPRRRRRPDPLPEEPEPPRQHRPFPFVPSGVLLIVAGSVGGALLIVAGLIVQSNAASMSWLFSVSGTSVNEAFYRASGGVWKGVGFGLQGLGVFYLLSGVGLGMVAVRFERELHVSDRSSTR